MSSAEAQLPGVGGSEDPDEVSDESGCTHNPCWCDDDERTYLELMAEYECPSGCDFADVLSEDEALALFIAADGPLCPLCDEELEEPRLSVEEVLALVDVSRTDTPASAHSDEQPSPAEASEADNPQEAPRA